MKISQDFQGFAVRLGLLVALTISLPLLLLAGQAKALQTTISSGPEDAETITVNSATFTFEADGPATFVCSENQGSFRPCSSPVVMTNLKNGRQSFAVRAIGIDGPNDSTPDVRKFKVDLSTEPVGPSPQCIAARKGLAKAKASLRKANAIKATTKAAKRAKARQVRGSKARLARARAVARRAC